MSFAISLIFQKFVETPPIIRYFVKGASLDTDEITIPGFAVLCPGG
jgi:hypothetical protein